MTKMNGHCFVGELVSMPEDHLLTLRDRIRKGDFVEALNLLVKNLIPCSPESFKRDLSPLVTECFQPQWGSGNHGCLLLNAHKQNAEATKVVSLELLRKLVEIRTSLAERFGASDTLGCRYNSTTGS